MLLRLNLSRKCDNPGRMIHGGDNLLHEIRSSDPQRRGVDAGVTTEVFALQYIFIHQQLYMMIMVVHEAQDTDRTGSDV